MSDTDQPSVQSVAAKAETLPPSDALGTLHPASSDTPVQRYQLLYEIACGGMGAVWRATDNALGREVAVKVLQDKYAPDSGAARRFSDEARITAQLQHPAIPPVHDIGTLPDGRPFLAMKLIKGQTLEKLLAERPDPSAERGRFVAVFEQICQAVAYAHAHGVIHRDLKPANVMVGAFGEVQVMDWGLAKVLLNLEGQQRDADPEATRSGTEIVSLRDSDGSYTQTGSVLGTLAFMPPEQAIGAVGHVGRRSDVFGLGAILAVILTGKPPFAAGSAEASHLQAALGEVDDCFARLDGCGAEPELVELCKRCLNPKALERPAEGREVAAAVASLRQAAEERARAAELERVRAEGEQRAAELQAAEERKRRRLAVALAAAVLTLVVVGGGGFTIAAIWLSQARNCAVEALGREEAARRVAEEMSKQKESQRRRAEGLAEDNRRNLYAARINLAQQSWEKGDLAKALELLNSIRPPADQEDLRGFEWRYLWRLCRSEQFALPIAGKPGMTPRRRDSSSFTLVDINQGRTVRSVVFAPDGRSVATAGDDLLVRLWNPATGEEQRTLEGHTSFVSAVAFAPDGKTLASASRDGTVIVWDRETGKKQKALTVHGDPVNCLAFSPDGALLATGTARPATGKGNPLQRFVYPSMPGEVKLWDLATGKERASLKGHASGVLSVAFAPDGKTLASAGADWSVRLWDVSTGKARETLPRFSGPIFSLAFGADGKTLALGGGDLFEMESAVVLWDVEHKKSLGDLPGHRGPVFAVAFSADGKTLATGGYDRIVRLWDVSARQERESIKGHTSFIWSLAFAPDGRTLATGSWDGFAKVWDTSRRQEYDVLKSPGTTYTVSVSPDGKLLASSGRAVVRVWDLQTGKLRITLEQDKSDTDISVAFAPDGRTLAAGGLKGEVKLWDVETWQCQTTLKVQPHRLTHQTVADSM